MFDFFKKSTVPALEGPPLFEDFDQTTVTAADLKWGHRIHKLVRKDLRFKASFELHQALAACDRSRIAIGLYIQSRYPDMNLLVIGDPRSLYYQVWDSPADIAEMYIKAYHPTEMETGWSKYRRVFNYLDPATCLKWSAQGCGEFVNPIFYTLVQKGNADQIDQFLSEKHAGFDINWRKNLFLKEAIKRKDPEILQIVLDQKPDLRIDVLNILELAVLNDNADIPIRIGALDGSAPACPKTAFRAAVKQTLAQIEPDTSDWKALSAAFVEYTRPHSAEGPKTFYQFDFESGYINFYYQTKDGYQPVSIKTITETQAENPQLIERAVKALTDAGHPAPDLGQAFNQAGAKPSLQKIEKPITAQYPKRRR